MQSNTLMPEAEHVIRIAAAVVLGGLIGLERELRDKPAGFRTITLICLGACVFTILSEVAGAQDYEHTRIAAQVVTGIGFLGAGAILRDRANVLGLTTAASIWAVAAVGMACGFGKFGIALVGTLAALTALMIFNMVEHRIGDLRDIQTYRVATENTEDAVDRVYARFREYRIKIKKCTWSQDGEQLVFQIVAMAAKRDHERFRRFMVRTGEYTLR